MRSTEPTSGEPTGAGTTGVAGIPDSSRPRRSAAVRLTFDEVRGQHVLLGPESVLVLNATGAAVLELSDGRWTVGEIVEELRGRFDGVKPGEVRAFLDHLVAKRCVEVDHA